MIVGRWCHSLATNGSADKASRCKFTCRYVKPLDAIRFIRQLADSAIGTIKANVATAEPLAEIAEVKPDRAILRAYGISANSLVNLIKHIQTHATYRNIHT